MLKAKIENRCAWAEHPDMPERRCTISVPFMRGKSYVWSLGMMNILRKYHDNRISVSLFPGDPDPECYRGGVVMLFSASGNAKC